MCWFLAGASLLPLYNNDSTTTSTATTTTGQQQQQPQERLGVDLPKVRDTYGPHKTNYERLQQSTLRDWRLLCPGPMVEAESPIGLDRLRVSIEALPTSSLPSFSSYLPSLLLLPLFAMKIPEMIIPYADAASVILANVDPDNTAMSKRRVGVALPVGMKGQKQQWAAQPQQPVKP